jgi:hypothetical protein
MIRVTVLDTLSAYGSFHEVSTEEKRHWGWRFVHLVAGAMRAFNKAVEDATTIVDVGDIEPEDQPERQSIPESHQHQAARQKLMFVIAVQPLLARLMLLFRKHGRALDTAPASVHAQGD